MRRYVLGVTGAIGAGKSTVCGVLARRGWSVLDVDDVAAAALVAALPDVAPKVPALLAADGSVNKTALFAAMLREPELRKDLEKLLRPFIVRRVADWVAGLTTPGVLDAALLFESGLNAFCDATLCVQCDAAERQRRVGQRQTASAQHFAALEAAQWSAAAKLARADVAINTASSLSALEAQISAVLTQLGIPT